MITTETVATTTLDIHAHAIPEGEVGMKWTEVPTEAQEEVTTTDTVIEETVVGGDATKDIDQDPQLDAQTPGVTTTQVPEVRGRIDQKMKNVEEAVGMKFIEAF